MAGTSFYIDTRDSLTPALGIALTDPLIIKGDLIGALFWDRDDSLLASLTVNGSSNFAIRINLYPDFISVGKLRMGYYLAYSKAGETFFGINISMPAGVSASL